MTIYQIDTEVSDRVKEYAARTRRSFADAMTVLLLEALDADERACNPHHYVSAAA